MAQSMHKPPSMVFLLTPGLTLSDWESMPNMRRLMNEGAVGLMNTRTARMANDKHREPPIAALLTLGAGARAECPVDPGLAVASDAMPPVIWKAKNWWSIEAANRHVGYDIHLGNLPDAFDQAKIPFHSFVLFSDIGEPRPSDPDDASYLAIRSAGWSTGSPFWLGGTATPGCYIESLGGPPDQNLDNGIVFMAERATKAYGCRVLILSPYVNDRAYAAGDRLAPVLMLGPGIPPGTLLYSPSTRTPGLISNTDIAPTIADYFGLTLSTPPVGRVISIRAANHSVDDVDDIRSTALKQRHGQKIVPYCAVAMGLWLAGLAIATGTGRYKAGPKLSRFQTIAAPIILPFCLLAGLIVAGSVWEFDQIVGIFLFACIGGEIVIWIANRRHTSTNQGASLTARGLRTMVSTLALFPIIDCLSSGDAMSRRDLLGYSAIEGARYYGLGNEMLGVLVGASLVWFCGSRAIYPLAGRLANFWLIASMAALLFLVGAPSLGAKAGGVIVLGGSFVTLLASARGRRLTWRRGIAAGAVGILVLLAFAVVDSTHASQSQSHMGTGIALIRQGGIKEAVDIIVRKAAVEFKLATHSTWALPVWSGFVCLLLQRRASRRFDEFAARPTSERGMIALDNQLPRNTLMDASLVAAILLLLFNDAGAVACALLLTIVCCFSATAYAEDFRLAHKTKAHAARQLP